jgi:hypothetical protein
MTAKTTLKMLGMAASAAIFTIMPSVAMAAVCSKGGLNFADYLPMLDRWIAAQGSEAEQIRQFFTPEACITGAILIWLVLTSSTRSTITAIAWFLCLAIYHAVGYLSIDLADPYYQAAIAEGCVENSPRKILSNFGFAVIAALLTYQRMRRQKSG